MALLAGDFPLPPVVWLCSLYLWRCLLLIKMFMLRRVGGDTVFCWKLSKQRGFKFKVYPPGLWRCNGQVCRFDISVVVRCVGWTYL